ncbi:unnamed protein product [Musa acuminata subsp. malaccensis]|uniref:(wild Malaysian banana) hypothetical protein n=1 Tax=Musa acuminata subsp. malaccensis TaxID=214687 RepID=A0A804IGQ3_MUSAM|nr:PREDICTED: uncharacterized protein LOC103978806 [Musa acuminata subsp. malaccensis]CAG1851394.1 unnamed protein product [Musa acuminata subsp. malaccensis]
MAKYLLLRLLSLTRVAMPINQITSTKLSSPSLVVMSRTIMRNPERGSHALTRLMVQPQDIITSAHDGRLSALHESHLARDREAIVGAIIHQHDLCRLELFLRPRLLSSMAEVACSWSEEEETEVTGSSDAKEKRCVKCSHTQDLTDDGIR